MKSKEILVKTSNKNYSIFIGSQIIKNLSRIFKNKKMNFTKCLIILDTNIPKKYVLNIKKNLKINKIYIYKFVSNEKNKNFKSVNKILRYLFDHNFSRNDTLISVGGGITGDVAGFAASIYKRGLKFINIPTTLLSQLDSSIGGKTGINTSKGKNLIGSFYQPDLVISDTSFLKSLPKREIICGYGEMLKHSLISSKKNFSFLNKSKNKIINLKNPYIEKAIVESCKIKKNVVQKDEREKNYRKVLNLGHTFAHAYEASLGYSNKLNHGEAVILGINSALNFSYQNNILNESEFFLISKHIKDLKIKINLKKFFKKKDIKKIIRFMKTDKKNYNEKINLILLKRIGKPTINNSFNPKKIQLFLNRELNN